MSEYNGHVTIEMEADTSKLKKDLEEIKKRIKEVEAEGNSSSEKAAENAEKKSDKAIKAVKKNLAEYSQASGKNADEVKADIDKIAYEYQSQGEGIAQSYKRVYRELGISADGAMQEQIAAAQKATKEQIASAEAVGSAVKKTESIKQETNKNTKKSIADVADEREKIVKELQEDADKIARKYQKSGNSIAESYRRAYEEIGAESDEAMEKQIRNAERAAEYQKKNSELIANIAKAGLAATTSAIASIAAVGINYNSDMENYIANFSTLLGSVEKSAEHIDALKTFAAQSPFEMSDLATASQMLQSMGLSVDEVLPALKMLGDISLGNKEKLSGLALVLSQVKSQGKLMGNDIYQFINNGFNPLQIIAEKTGKSMSALKDEMSEGKITYEMVADALKTATSEGGKFYKAMENTSKTLKGQMSTLKSRVSEMSGEIIKPLYEYIANKLIPKCIEFLNSIDAAKIIDVVQKIHSGFMLISPAIASAAAGMVAFKLSMGIAGVIKQANTALAKFNAMLLANPVTIWITAITAAVAAATVLGLKLTETTREIKSMIDSYDKSIASIEKAEKEQINQAEMVKILRDRVISLNDSIKSGMLTDEEAAAKKQQLKQAVNELNEAIPGLEVKINEETGALETQKQQIYALSEAYIELAKTKAKADAYQQKMTEAEKTRIALQDKIDAITTEQKELIKKSGSTNPFISIPIRFQAADNGKALRDAETELQDLNDSLIKWEKEYQKIQVELSREQSLYNELSGDNKIKTTAPSTVAEEKTNTGEDYRKTAFEKRLKQLKYYLDMDEITEEKYYDALESLRDKYFKKDTDEYRQYTVEIYKYNKSVANEEVKLKEEALKTQQQEQAKAQETLVNLIESANKQKIQLEEAYAEKVVKINEDLQKDITNLQNEYTNELSNRTNSIYRSFGLFDSFEAEAKSDSRLTRALKSQLKAYEMYSESLQRLRDRGVSQDFVAELEDIGVAAVDEIRTISKMSNTRLEEYVNLWSEKHALAASEAEKQIEPLKNQTEKQIELLKENARTALDELDKEFKQGLDDIEKTIESSINEYVPQMNLIGENLADGIIEGLSSRGLALSLAMSEVLRNAVNTAKDELGIHSPSRVMRDEIGEQMGKGIEIGLLGSIRNIDFSSVIDMFKTAFDQMFAPTGLQGRERTHINNNITVQSGGGQAIMHIEGREMAKILFPFLLEEQRIQGVDLIT